MMHGLEEIIRGAILGDAAGYTLNGFKKAHLNAMFREHIAYPDTAPGLKHGMDKWRKPGLYSSITQFILFAGACTENRFFNVERFLKAVRNTPELPDQEYSFFRDPGPAEKHLITYARDNKQAETRFDLPCARIIPISLPLLLVNQEDEGLIIPAIEFSGLFTFDISTAIYSAVFILMIHEIIKNTPGIFEAACASAETVLSYFRNNPHLIFNTGFNPDSAIDEAERISGLFSMLKKTSTIDQAEKLICEEANKKLKTPITRGSVNLPAAVFPFALSIAAHTPDPEKAVFSAVFQGGAASALGSVTGAIVSACNPDFNPDILTGNLVNKKKILSVIHEIVSGKNRKSVIDELLMSETSLTNKENEEYAAKNKKSDKNAPIKPEKTRKQAQDLINRHVVESWTKTDKARWRKENSRKKEDDD